MADQEQKQDQKSSGRKESQGVFVALLIVVLMLVLAMQVVKSEGVAAGRALGHDGDDGRVMPGLRRALGRACTGWMARLGLCEKKDEEAPAPAEGFRLESRREGFNNHLAQVAGMEGAD
jgi:hypothetical protein